MLTAICFDQLAAVQQLGLHDLMKLKLNKNWMLSYPLTSSDNVYY